MSGLAAWARKKANRLDDLITSMLDRRYWVCRHHWCFRESTYDYRCWKHQDDPDDYV